MSLTMHRVDARDLQPGMAVWWEGQTRRVKRIDRADAGRRWMVLAADGVNPERSVLLGRFALVQVKGDA